MPFVNLKTNVKIEDKADLQLQLAEAICVIPKKTVDRTMVQINDSESLYFAGTDAPCAMVETLVNAGTDQSTVQEYSYAVIDLLSAKYAIPETRIYVTVSATDNWYSK